MSKLIMNVGGMFSGKSTLLQQQGKRHMYAKQNVVFLKPAFDNRYSEDEIVTHEGNSVKAINVDDTLSKYGEIWTADVVLIDEIQFFPLSVVYEIKQLLAENIMVYVSGLDMNYRGRGFLVVEELMTIADEINKLKAVCEMCGKDAGFTGKRHNHINGATVSINVSGENISEFELGEKELYIPLCRNCFNKLTNKGGCENV